MPGMAPDGPVRSGVADGVLGVAEVGVLKPISSSNASLKDSLESWALSPVVTRASMKPRRCNAVGAADGSVRPPDGSVVVDVLPDGLVLSDSPVVSVDLTGGVPRVVSEVGGIPIDALISFLKASLASCVPFAMPLAVSVIKPRRCKAVEGSVVSVVGGVPPDEPVVPVVGGVPPDEPVVPVLVDVPPDRSVLSNSPVVSVGCTGGVLGVVSEEVGIPIDSLTSFLKVSLASWAPFTTPMMVSVNKPRRCMAVDGSVRPPDGSVASGVADVPPEGSVGSNSLVAPTGRVLGVEPEVGGIPNDCLNPVLKAALASWVPSTMPTTVSVAKPRRRHDAIGTARSDGSDYIKQKPESQKGQRRLGM